MIKLGKIWRIVATGFCFFVFTFGAFIFSCLLLPVLGLVTRDKQVLRHRTRFVVQKFFRFITLLSHYTGCMRLRVEGLEQLRSAKGVLILANHPTLIDVVVLMGLIPQANCIIKSSLFRTFALGRTLRFAGYVENRDSDNLMNDCLGAMDGGHPLIIFPEGTRTTPGEAMVFQRGPSHLLLATRRTFLPIIIQCRPHALLKGQPWYDVPERRFELEVKVLDLVNSEQWVGALVGEPRPIAVRELTRYLELYFISKTTPTIIINE